MSKKITTQALHKWNLVLGSLHLLQGIVILILSKGVTFPVTTSFLTIDRSASDASGEIVLGPATKELFQINLAYLIVGFFFMSAVAHLLIATRYRKSYESNLSKGINKARWIEYSLSASTMIVAIAIIAGIADLSTLLMMFTLTAIMNLLGLVMEVHNQKVSQVNWLAYSIGCIAGIVPWIVYAYYVYGSKAYGMAGPPGFVYVILVSIFLFFNCFALNMYWQYKRKGRWSNYLYGERVYMILSLVAKSALAWQVFAGTLRP